MNSFSEVSLSSLPFLYWGELCRLLLSPEMSLFAVSGAWYDTSGGFSGLLLPQEDLYKLETGVSGIKAAFQTAEEYVRLCFLRGIAGLFNTLIGFLL